MIKKKSAKFVNLLFLILIFLLGVFLYAKYMGVKGLIVKEYRVESNILSDNFSGIKIVHISDILYGSSVNKDDIKKLVDKVNELKPDIIVFTGDLSKNKKLKAKDVDFLTESLSNMNATIGKYAIKGDYDYSNEDFEDIISSSEFILLNNSNDKIYYDSNEYIHIVGIPSIQKEVAFPDTAFDFYTDENRKYIILLVHEGNTISEINNTEYEVDLILGGHSLNGSINLPYYGALFVPEDSSKYYDDYYEKGITKIFISSGIGTDMYPYRLNNRPSINLYRLKSK